MCCLKLFSVNVSEVEGVSTGLSKDHLGIAVFRNGESVGENHFVFIESFDVALFLNGAVGSVFGFVLTSTENVELAFQNGFLVVESPVANELVTFGFVVIANFTSVDVLLAVFIEFHNVIQFVTAKVFHSFVDVLNASGTVTRILASASAQSPTFFNAKFLSHSFLLVAGSENENNGESHCSDA